MKIKFLIIFSIVFVSCSGTYHQNLNFNPVEHLRVAVLPFVFVDKNGKINNQESRLLLDNLELVSSQLQETPSQIIRRSVIGELHNSALDVVSPALIDIELPHHGFGLSDGSIDLEKLVKTDPRDICKHLIDCDAVMYGKVTKWDRSYYGLQSVNTVGIELKIVSGKDGEVLFSSEGSDSESRGISKVPTGISSIVIEPLLGLDSAIIVELSHKIVKKMLDPLNLMTRPEYLETGPPVIYASANEKANTISSSNPLVVVAMGTEHQSASFSIGTFNESIPMFERGPGRYYGEYIPLPGDTFLNQKISISLKDKYGRITKQETSQSPLSYSNLNVTPKK